MKINQVLKEIRGVFKKPKKITYFGKVKHGTPYFYPWNYCGTIFKTRVIDKNYTGKYYGRCKKIFDFNILNKRVEIYIGYPIKILNQNIGWKDKWDSPRFEWSPAFHIFFFGLQYFTYLKAPVNNRQDNYWEMILWWKYYCDKDINKAEKTWGWVDGSTKKSTWNKECLL